MRRLVCFILVSAAAFAQVAEKANEGYKTHEGREKRRQGFRRSRAL